MEWVRVVVLAACTLVGQTAVAGQLPDDAHPVSRNRLPPIERQDLDQSRHEAFDAVMRAEGPSASAALRLHGSGTDLRFSGPVGRPLTEVAILITAREIDQLYEWAMHELDGLAVGVDEVLIDIIRHREPLDGVGGSEAVIMEVGRELLSTHALSADTYARALARLGQTNLVDLIVLIGNYVSTGATLTAFNQQMPMGWRQSLPLPFALPDDIHPDSRNRLPLRPGPYRTSVNALYGRMASPGGIGPGQIRAYGKGRGTREDRVGRRTMMLAILATARAHDSQYDWTMHEPLAREAGVEPALIDAMRLGERPAGLAEADDALLAFAEELFDDNNVSAETYRRMETALGVPDLVDLVALMGAHAADAAVLAAFDQRLPEGVEPRLPTP